MSAPTAVTPDQLAACRALFDKHPDDVIGALAESGRVLQRLEVLFTVLEEMAGHEATATNPNRVQVARIASLAGAGRHVAADMANSADCESEAMRAQLRKGSAA